MVTKSVLKSSLPIVLAALALINGEICVATTEYYDVGISMEIEVPNEGVNVSTLTWEVEVEIEITSNKENFTVEPGKYYFTVYWYRDGVGKVSETHTIDYSSPYTKSSFTTSYSDPEGEYLDGTYWVKIVWSDKDGAHSEESTKEECTVE
ncbi:hypothetical protein JXM67_01680 [candidate division WOR-3 bacterium]|nr:hypothetical protein [candidate division WOR-3 bacterium]